VAGIWISGFQLEFMAGEVSVLALLDLMGTGMMRAFFLRIWLHKTHEGLLPTGLVYDASYHRQNLAFTGTTTQSAFETSFENCEHVT
jgi:hypothetical protein